jgi:hypothetical protein
MSLYSPSEGSVPVLDTGSLVSGLKALVCGASLALSALDKPTEDLNPKEDTKPEYGGWVEGIVW